MMLVGQVNRDFDFCAETIGQALDPQSLPDQTFARGKGRQAGDFGDTFADLLFRVGKQNRPQPDSQCEQSPQEKHANKDLHSSTLPTM